MRGILSFVTKELTHRIVVEAVAVWGKVGSDPPPHLVMPLTVEPNKPRLCHDERFLNLWMRDMPFSLDSVVHLTRYVGKGHWQTMLDDKSGYDHALLSLILQAAHLLVSNAEVGGWLTESYLSDGKSRHISTRL